MTMARKTKPENDDDNNNNNIIPDPKLDRRGFLLIGFGSSRIYDTVSNLNTFSQSPLSPDFSNCADAVKPDGKPINCCPPSHPPPPPAEISDFVPPSAAAHGAVRVRAAAQYGGAPMEKYKKAVDLMKKLPATDPRSFAHQANVHCAYCDGAYSQLGFPRLKFEIHQSWLFFPFHRWYLYFFERICARLLDDDTFALPFWNWDSPAGMHIPAMFAAADSPLYDRLRDRDHSPPAVVDLNWDGSPTGLAPETQIEYNLSVMYKQMITNATTPRLFMGQPIKPGDDTTSLSGAGSVEIAPHNTLHVWTGDPREANTENMGVFYSAARDPIFYPHHANVDRLWTIWVNKFRGKNFTDPDWLETSFVFFDEEKNAVRVKIKDCLDLNGLGYTYQRVETPWINAKPRPRRGRGCYNIPPHNTPEITRVLPKTLDEVLNVIVKRPRRSRTEKEKEEEEEVLLIEGTAQDSSQHVKFDVYVNEDNVESCTPMNTEFLGSFASVPHGHRHGDDDDGVRGVRVSQRFGMSSVLEEVGADEDDVVLVTLVPKRGSVRIDSIRIEFDASKSCP